MSNMIGEKYINNKGLEFTVVGEVSIKYKSGYKLWREVEFTKTKHRKLAHRSKILKGSVKDPYDRHIKGVACLGQIKKYRTEDYDRWLNMIYRCYGDFDNYEGCTVSDSWLCFEHYHKDLLSMKNYGLPHMHMDKDLTRKGNKEYCLEYCCLVHMNLNSSHGRFNGCWVATKAGAILKTTFSAELAELIGTSKSNIRQAHSNGGLAAGWKITQE